jgi:hypothetical protein
MTMNMITAIITITAVMITTTIITIMSMNIRYPSS